MKMLTMIQNQDYVSVYDEDVKIFEGEFTQEGELRIYLKNAYGHEISRLQQIKSGFKLFQGSKKEEYNWMRSEDEHGIFTHSKTSQSLKIGKRCYEFYSGKLAEKDMIFGYEDQRFVFQCDMVQEKSTLFLKDSFYCDIAILYTMFFIAAKHPYSDTSSFFSNMPEDMMTLL